MTIYSKNTEISFINRDRQLPLIMKITIYSLNGEVYDGFVHWSIRLPRWAERIILNYWKRSRRIDS